VTLAGVFLAAALAIQSLRIWTPVIGVLINALMVVLYYRGGLQGALLLAVATPIGAAIVGVLPVIFIGMVPVLAVGNALLIWVYHSLSQRGAVIRVLVPSLGKSLFIGLAGYGVLSAFAIPEALKPLSLVLLGQQFFTAGIGILFGERVCRAAGVALARATG